MAQLARAANIIELININMSRNWTCSTKKSTKRNEFSERHVESFSLIHALYFACQRNSHWIYQKQATMVPILLLITTAANDNESSRVGKV